MDTKKAIKQLKSLEKLIKGDTTRLAAQWPQEYQMLIATILSAQTRDEVTIEVCDVLFKKYPKISDLAKANPFDVQTIISKVNFAPTKTRRIIQTAQMIGKKPIPKTLDELIVFPGVGRKVANVYLAEAHKASTIGVDTHVARISQKLGWSKNSNPHTIEKDLEKLFPKKYWQKINEICVRFGKSLGRSRRQEDEILKGLM